MVRAAEGGAADARGPPPPLGGGHARPQGGGMHGARGVLPPEVETLVNAALVAELTVVAADGRPISYPLIPLYDGQRIYFTSAVLFSRKLAHIRANPKVSVSLSDPVGVPAEPFHRATIQGDAQVVDGDLHNGWERLLPLWRAKEPIIDT